MSCKSCSSNFKLFSVKKRNAKIANKEGICNGCSAQVNGLLSRRCKILNDKIENIINNSSIKCPKRLF